MSLREESLTLVRRTTKQSQYAINVIARREDASLADERRGNLNMLIGFYGKGDCPFPVIPAKAGIQAIFFWIPNQVGNDRIMDSLCLAGNDKIKWEFVVKLSTNIFEVEQLILKVKI